MMIERKPMLHLLPPGPLADVARVLEHGANKHNGPWSWTENGRLWSEHYNAAQRHMMAWWIGESIDPESGMSHLAHAAARLVIALELERSGRGLDNRPTGLLSKP